MRAFALAATLAVGLASPALAQRSGTYAVTGTGADGTRYEGAVQLQATGPQTWRITWRIAGESVTGVGMTTGNLLVVGYTMGREVGVAWYEAQPDGSLVGRWPAGREGGVGTETLLPR